METAYAAKDILSIFAQVSATLLGLTLLVLTYLFSNLKRSDWGSDNLPPYLLYFALIDLFLFLFPFVLSLIFLISDFPAMRAHDVPIIFLLPNFLLLFVYVIWGKTTIRLVKSSTRRYKIIYTVLPIVSFVFIIFTSQPILYCLLNWDFHPARLMYMSFIMWLALGILFSVFIALLSYGGSITLSSDKVVKEEALREKEVRLNEDSYSCLLEIQKSLSALEANQKVQPSTPSGIIKSIANKLFPPPSEQ